MFNSKRIVKRLVTFAIVVFVATIQLSQDNIDVDVSSTESTNNQTKTEQKSSPIQDSIITKVLIARTVSPSEVPNVVADVKRINSYRKDSENAAAYLARSVSQCNETFVMPSPEKETEIFPNHILCHTAKNGNSTMMPNYFASTKIDFLLFARNEDVAKTIQSSLIEGDDVSNLINVDILDVSLLPTKIWSWISWLDDKRLQPYNYVWMVDGDIIMSSVNWQAFWQQVHLLRPKISQATIVGGSPPASIHQILQYRGYTRLIAAETAIIELGMPLFEVNTWLAFRNQIQKEDELTFLSHLKSGGEDCFDLTWCHFARTEFKQPQAWPRRGVGYIDSDPSYTTFSNGTTSVDGFYNRSCVIFWQVPIKHADKRSLGKHRNFRYGGQQICLYLRRKYHIMWAVQSVFDMLHVAFNAMGPGAEAYL